ncbi:hypothetical protein Tco_0991902 [Tanacetum coccineum]|uniref:Uncharacterized protein n=1 Tax=Tanacetum coccineum TaxID=301880 RepID=A0ABQ5F0P5_9ASTR
MPYSLYAKLSLETLKQTKLECKFKQTGFIQCPHIRIAENMLVEVGKFTFPVDFVILEMEEDSKVPLTLNERPSYNKQIRYEAVVILVNNKSTQSWVVAPDHDDLFKF